MSDENTTPPASTPPLRQLRSSPFPVPKVLAAAQAIFLGVATVVQFFDGFLEGWLQIVATLVTTAIAAVIGAGAWIWHRHRDQHTEVDPRLVDRWVAAVVILTIGVLVLDVVAFATAETEPAQPRRINLYDVTGATAAGAVSYPINPGGSVTQAFTAPEAEITAVVVIAGLDDEIADLEEPHPLTMHLWSDDHDVDETVQLPDLVNKGGTRFDLRSPVEVEAGETLRFEIRNDSAHDPVGFYLKPISGGETGADDDSSVHILGHRNMNKDYNSPGWAISGVVEAIG